MVRLVKFLVCIIFAALALNSSAQINKEWDKILKMSTPVGMKKKAIKAIAKSIFKSKYKDWKITEAQREIFKDSETDSLIAYKITVNSAANIHYLFYKVDGTLILDKNIEP